MRNATLKPSREMIAEASAWLIEFRADEPTQAQRDEFSAWLCTSPQHIQAYLEVAGAWSELPDKDPEGRIDVQEMIRTARASPANVVALRTQELGKSEPSSPLRMQRPSRLPFGLAAAVLLVVLAGTATYLYAQRGTYSTATGERRSLTLADGSTVELNAQSEIRVRYTDEARIVELLRGQALFQVAKDRVHPFVVDTGDTRVRAVGTQFDVYRKPGGTVVTVVEGSVAVTGSGTIFSLPDPAPILLAAGQQLTVPAVSAGPAAQAAPRAANIEAATAWTRKRLVFDNTPLAEVAQEFNRYSTRPLVIESPVLQQLGVSGLYSSTDPTALIAFLRTQPGILVTETDSEIKVTRQPD